MDGSGSKTLIKEPYLFPFCLFLFIILIPVRDRYWLIFKERGRLEKKKLSSFQIFKTTFIEVSNAIYVFFFFISTKKQKQNTTVIPYYIVFYF